MITHLLDLLNDGNVTRQSVEGSKVNLFLTRCNKYVPMAKMSPTAKVTCRRCKTTVLSADWRLEELLIH